MNSRNVLSILLAATLPALGPAFAGETLERSFPFPAGSLLDMEVDGGSIEYVPGGSGEIHIQAVADTGKVSDYLDLSFEPSSEGLRVRGDKVGSSGGILSRWFGGGSEVPVRFRIEGPARVDLKLSTAGGDVTLGDVEGEIRLATSGGDIAFGEVRGRLKAATSGGDIDARYVEEGSVATSGGDIQIAEAGGDFGVATSGGDIKVDRAQGKLDAATSGGDIRLGDIDGDLEAKTSGGSIEIESAGASLNVATSGGDIEIESARGEARLSTSGGRIRLASADGHVSASTSGGDLDVTLTSGEGGELETSGGTLLVRLPSGMGFDVDADARGGRVTSDVAIRGSVGQDRIEGTIGSGGNLLRLRNQDGDIQIQSR